MPKQTQRGTLWHTVHLLQKQFWFSEGFEPKYTCLADLIASLRRPTERQTDSQKLNYSHFDLMVPKQKTPSDFSSLLHIGLGYEFTQHLNPELLFQFLAGASWKNATVLVTLFFNSHELTKNYSTKIYKLLRGQIGSFGTRN